MGQIKLFHYLLDLKPFIFGGARGVVFIVVGNEHGDSSLNPGRDISHSTNTLGKGMNPIILPPAMGK